jgi:hypothetical protein
MSLSSPRAARAPSRRTRVRRDGNAFLHRLRRGRKQVRRVWQRLGAAPRAVRIAVIALALLAVFSVTNLVYQVARKPTELFFFVSGALDKMPAETWHEYAPLFREYATATITPELLAALAQVESAGNPLALTYWRWRLTWHPFAIYQPASSAVGMYQMTDAAFAEARPYCIHHHAVIADGCWFNGLYTRVLPSHAVELTAAFLDRNVAAILARRPHAAARPRQKQDLAIVIHLCGAGRGEVFARHGFHPIRGERCGDHDVASYLARVDAMARLFRHLAAER